MKMKKRILAKMIIILWLFGIAVTCFLPGITGAEETSAVENVAKGMKGEKGASGAQLGVAVEDKRERLADNECMEILSQMSRVLASNESLQARFVQERHLAVFGDVLRSEGFFYYRIPGRIRWEFVQPYASITIMLEKGEVEKFDVINNRAVRVEIGARKVMAEVLGQIASWQKGELTRATGEFDMVMYRNDRYKLVLRPLSRGLARIMSQLEFEIDPVSFLVHSVNLRESENDYTVIRFLDQEVNKNPPAELFDLKNPVLVNRK